MPRHFGPAIILAFAACTQASESTDPGDTTPARFTVNGVVYDSLANAVGVGGAVTGAMISINGVPATSDGQGRFTAEGVSGTDHGLILVQSRAHETLEVSLAIDGDFSISLGLRRYAPLMTEFMPSGDSTRFRVVDLQNRKTVERWQATRATLHSATGEWTEHGDQWVWTPIDDFTWLVSMQGTTDAEEFEFTIHDVTGFSSSAHCQVDSGCDHLASSGQPDG